MVGFCCGPAKKAPKVERKGSNRLIDTAASARAQLQYVRSLVDLAENNLNQLENGPNLEELAQLSFVRLPVVESEGSASIDDLELTVNPLASTTTAKTPARKVDMRPASRRGSRGKLTPLVLDPCPQKLDVPDYFDRTVTSSPPSTAIFLDDIERGPLKRTYSTVSLVMFDSSFKAPPPTPPTP
eukprot:Sspe_Gene.31843::Locus_15662_Transcript_1_1_Confidence_1.000_Length_722::g.31843::m.31843